MPRVMKSHHTYPGLLMYPVFKLITCSLVTYQGMSGCREKKSVAWKRVVITEWLM
jgi:hypothetical protein